MKSFAPGLDLPQVTPTLPLVDEALKAHGKLWGQGSFSEDVAVFKACREERRMMMHRIRRLCRLHSRPPLSAAE